MTRTDALKGVYLARWTMLIGFGIGAEVLVRHRQTGGGIAFGVLFVVVLLSGCVQAYFWSDLLAGLHHLNRRDFQASKIRSMRFLAQLRERAWLRRLIWLGPSSYSLSAEAVALNNLGAAELALGELDAARGHFERAIAADPACPLPFRNMGVLVLRTGASEEAAPWFTKAAALGLRGDWSDRMAIASQRNNAELSTTGPVTEP